MNLDFHYYGTYMAARVAGYSKEEAQIICYAAQLVDDNTIHTQIDSLPFQEIVTYRDSKDIIEDAENPLPYTKEDEAAAREIWCPFHFLPGNENYKVQYKGKMYAGVSWLPIWNFEHDSKQKFKLMTLPQSSLANEMINRGTAKATLEEIGLKMHILADTWAHQYFAGTPEWAINDIRQSKGLYEFQDNTWHEIHCILSENDLPKNHQYQVPGFSSPYYVSPRYLGHAQIGHLADYGFVKFKYLPVWREEFNGERHIERDNTEDFLKAFRQMVAALSKFKKGTSFTASDDIKLEDKTEAEIKSVLSARKIDQSEEWIKAIKKLLGEDIPPYVINAWANRCRESSDKVNTNYARFHNAAKEQKELVMNFIGQNIK
ncbi:hypothetical protein OXPF_29460 [Oxobacter pfennigii]|uniref:Uncharacterized protein n=1 Tax=Oxobacter pfennigii TaxID=36849 RepID=A0A0P8W686_9CLOT|nr:DUF6765 family protein [Oxobacter pfennigii]KPU43505.1 hypothetical protein OXPF_29460 [Oxobacter pfennigii]